MVYFTDNIVRSNGKVTSNFLDIHISINDDKWLLKIRKCMWEEKWRAERPGHGPGAGNHLLAAADTQLQTEIVLWFPSQLPRHLARRYPCKARRGMIPANYDEYYAERCSTLAKSRLSRLCVFPVGYCWLLLVTAAIPIMHYFASLRLHNVQAMISQTHELASCTRPGHTGMTLK